MQRVELRYILSLVSKRYTLRILHISDLHAHGAREREHWRRHRVLGPAWEKNLQELAGAGPIDLVCFTGDLAFAGTADEYAEVTEFLDQTLALLGLGRERLFVVPGNHDIDRSIEPEAWQALRMLADPREDAAFSAWMAGGRPLRGVDASLRDAVLCRQQAYRTWVSETLGRKVLLPETSPHGRLGYRATVRLPGWPFDVHVIGFDSAWLAGDNHDSRKLRLTEDQVMRLTSDERGNPLAGFRLGLIHHPLTDLADGEHCRRLLAGRLDLLLRGHLHETEPETWADPARELRQLAAGCLYEHDRYPNACIVIEATLDAAGRPLRHDLRFRGWSARGFWFDDNSLYPGTANGRLTWTVVPEQPAPPWPPAARVFVGRETELAQLEAAVFGASAGQPVAICALHGMPGVGKSFLVDRFAQLHAARFPGGYVRLALEPDDPRTAEDLRDAVLGVLQIQDAGLAAWDSLCSRLQSPRTLLHIENADSQVTARRAAALIQHLAGCQIIVTGRFRELGRAASWACVEVPVLDETTALLQLEQELGPARDGADAEQRRSLVHMLGGLPLAIHLAAGYLAAGHTVQGFLRLLRRKGLDVEPVDPADPGLARERARAVLCSTFELSLDLLHHALTQEYGEPQAELFLAGLTALGHAPAEGVGTSLGAAMAGLNPEDYEDLVVRARMLSMLEVVPGALRPDGAVRAHPLLAEILRSRTERGAVIARMTDWFMARLPEHAEAQQRRWAEIQAETAAFVAWLAEIPDTDCARVQRAGARHATLCGPFLAWAMFCERCVGLTQSDEERSHALWILSFVARACGNLDRALAAARERARLNEQCGTELEVALAYGQVADVLEMHGDLDAALRIRQQDQLPVFERMGAERERAITLGKIADICEARGDLDAALRIRQQDQLPVFERMGAERERAITLGKIADVHEVHGDLDEALRVRRDVLPVYERLGDVRSHAITLSKIADVLQARGDLDEALRSYRQDVLPVYERLGDVRSHAITLSKIADVLQARGDLDEALRSYRQDVLPVFERLGVVRSRAITLGKIADVLQARGDLDEALRLRCQDVLPVFERLGDVRSRAITLGKIANALQARGDFDEALRLRCQDVLPVFERLGMRRELLMARTMLALLHLERARTGDRETAGMLLRQAFSDALAMRIPEASQIQAIMAKHGIAPESEA